MKQKVELLKEVGDKKKGDTIEVPFYVANKLVELKTAKVAKETKPKGTK